MAVLNRLRELLAPAAPSNAAPSPALATALLLIELSRADFEFSEVEINRIRDLLAGRFGLDGAAVDGLIADAQRKSRDSVSLHDYVQTLNRTLDADGKRELMQMLWQVAWADGRIDKYEEHLLRRLMDLLYIPMSDYVLAREQAATSTRA